LTAPAYLSGPAGVNRRRSGDGEPPALILKTGTHRQQRSARPNGRSSAVEELFIL
jgi:hypothetical protein